MQFYKVLILAFSLLGFSCRARQSNSQVQSDDKIKSEKVITLYLGGPIQLTGEQLELILATLRSYRVHFGKKQSENLIPKERIHPVFESFEAWSEYRARIMEESKKELEELQSIMKSDRRSDSSLKASEAREKLLAYRTVYEARVSELDREKASVTNAIRCLKESINQGDQNAARCQSELSSAELDLARIRDSYRTADIEYLRQRSAYVDYLAKSLSFDWNEAYCAYKPVIVKNEDLRSLQVYFGDVDPKWNADEYAIPSSNNFKYLNGYHLNPSDFDFAIVKRTQSPDRLKNDLKRLYLAQSSISRSDWKFTKEALDATRFWADPSAPRMSGSIFESPDPSFDRMFENVCKQLEANVRKRRQQTEAQGVRGRLAVAAGECRCESNVINVNVIGTAHFSY